MKIHCLLVSALFGMCLGLPGTVAAAPLSKHPVEQLEVPAESPAYAEFRTGVAALLRGDQQAAEKAFQAATRIDPALAAPLLGLADVALKQGRDKEAKQWLTKAALADPGSDQPHIGWARYHRTRKNYQDAGLALKKAIEAKPSAVAYLELGDLYLANLDDKPAALAAYEQAGALAPDNAMVRYSLAVGLAANGQVSRAIPEFERVAAMRPDDPEPWRAMGRLHAEQHRVEDAIRAFERGLSLQPNHVPLLVDRGDLAVAQGKPDEAVRYFEEAARQVPASSAVRVKLGLTFHLARRWNEAEAAYVEAIRLDAKAADAYNNLAWLLVERGMRLDEAVKWAEKATQLAPRRSSYFDTLGWAYRARGELDKSAQTLLKASRMEPPSADVHYHLGVVHAERGNRPDAVGALRRALELAPGFSHAADARDRLKALGG